MSGLRVLMITQKVDLDDDILGFTHTWVNKLAERVVWLHMLALSVGRHDLRDNVTLYSMGKEQGAARLRRLVNFNRVIVPLVLRRQVDVVFIHMCPLYAVLAAPWTKLRRVPVVMWYSHAHVSNVLRLAHAVSARVLTASAESYSLPAEKVRVVGHGIDVATFRPVESRPPNPRPRVLTVGRISPVKDYITLIEAANVLVNEMSRDVEFQIIGADPVPEARSYLDGLRRRVQTYGLEGYVTFVGSVPNWETLPYYQQADIFVNMQPQGGVGKAVLEAMATGLLVVLCTPTFNDQLGDYVPQVIFRERDSRDLARKLATVMDMDTDHRRDFGARVRRIAEGHNVDRLMDRIVGVFEGL